MKFRTSPLDLICITLAVLSLAGSLWYVKVSLSLTDVWVANRKIGPKEIIQAEDLTMIRVPSVFLNDNIIVDPSLIIGRNPISNYTIWRNSFIYQGTIEDSQNTKDGIHIGLEDEQVNYDLFVKDITVNPSHLSSGLYINIYLTVTNEKRAVSDLLFEGVKINALYDRKGQKITAKGSEEVEIITLVFMKEYVNILNEAIRMGKVSLVVGSDAFIQQDMKYNQGNKFFQSQTAVVE